MCYENGTILKGDEERIVLSAEGDYPAFFLKLHSGFDALFLKRMKHILGPEAAGKHFSIVTDGQREVPGIEPVHHFGRWTSFEHGKEEAAVVTVVRGHFLG